MSIEELFYERNADRLIVACVESGQKLMSHQSGRLFSACRINTVYIRRNNRGFPNVTNRYYFLPILYR